MSEIDEGLRAQIESLHCRISTLESELHRLRVHLDRYGLHTGDYYCTGRICTQTDLDVFRNEIDDYYLNETEAKKIFLSKQEADEKYRKITPLSQVFDKTLKKRA